MMKLQDAQVSMHNRNSQSMEQLATRIAIIEAKSLEGAGDERRNKGYIPIKNLVPKLFGDKVEEWRTWKEDFEDYLDMSNPGMKAYLKIMATQDEEETEEGREEKRREFGDRIVKDEVQVWRALKNLTTGEARKVVMTVKGENGFKVWQKMHVRFEKSLAAKHGAALAEFSAMASRTAKSPAETKRIITEIEESMKKLEETMGKDLDEDHAKSVLIGILDPITRQHTCLKHGQEVKFDTLRKLVLEFTSNATDDQTAMQLGSFMKPGADANDEEIEKEKDEWDEQLGAMGKGGGITCYTCGGNGHMSRDCPSKGKGKSFGNYGKSKGKGKSEGGKSQYGGYGKGENPYASYGKGGFGKGGDGKGSKGKDGSKGSGKGPLQGCWTCGGSHYQSNCPNAGKGGNLRHFEEHAPEEWWQPETRSLCCLSTYVEKTLKEKEAWEVSGKPAKKAKKKVTIKDNRKSFESINNWNKIANTENEKEQDNEIEEVQKDEKVNSPDELFEESCESDKKETRYVDTYEQFITELQWRAQWQEEERELRIRTQKQEQEILRRAKEGYEKKEKDKKELMLFKTILPEGLNPVSAKGEWELIEMAVDSGATETVVNDDMLKSVETKESWGSRKGVEYEVANGDTIPNLGEKKFNGVTETGITRNLTAQVCEVNKALLSVKKIIAAGNKVVFDDAGSYIEDKKSGEKMWLKEEGGMFLLRMWVKNSCF